MKNAYYKYTQLHSRDLGVVLFHGFHGIRDQAIIGKLYMIMMLVMMLGDRLIIFIMVKPIFYDKGADSNRQTMSILSQITGLPSLWDICHEIQLPKPGLRAVSSGL